jgi:hypothetical protein
MFRAGLSSNTGVDFLTANERVTCNAQNAIVLLANNLTDENPPRYGARQFFDEETHSIRGRVLYAEIGVTF